MLCKFTIRVLSKYYCVLVGVYDDCYLYCNLDDAPFHQGAAAFRLEKLNAINECGFPYRFFIPKYLLSIYATRDTICGLVDISDSWTTVRSRQIPRGLS